jgi:hypothetical protein
VGLPELYKINLKTGTEHRSELIDHCVKHRVLGLGWRTEWLKRVPRDYEDYYAAASSVWTSRQLAAVREFHDANPGSLVWFRDLQARYYLARLTGPWRPFDGDLAARLDLAMVRDVEHGKVESEASVPGAVVRGYAVPRQRAFSRVGHYGAKAYSAILASELLGGSPPEIEITPGTILRDLLGPLDVEDLVAAYLQTSRNYIALPARYAKSTAVFEYLLKHRGDGHIAAVQIKTGGQRIAIESLAKDAANKWFAYTDVDQELPSFVERIEAPDLIAFMENEPTSLPPVTERWMSRSN